MLVKIQSKGTSETPRGKLSKQVAGTVGIATADTPLERRTAQQRIHDAASATKWHISLCKSVPPKTVNEVLETEDDFSLTFVGGLTTPTCSNTSKTEPAANSQISRSDPG